MPELAGVIAEVVLKFQTRFDPVLSGARMTWAGARGETAAQMKKVLHAEGLVRLAPGGGTSDGEEAPLPMTNGKHDAQPRWSPDGRRLAVRTAAVHRYGENPDFRLTRTTKSMIIALD